MDESDDNFFLNLQNRTIRIFLKNGFKYEGRVEAVCKGFLQIFDYKINASKILRIDDIEDAVILK